VAQARVITDVQLLRAALGAFAPPGTLADLDAKVAYPFQTFKGRPEVGHFVELLDGEWKGQRGVIVKDDKRWNQYQVKLADGTTQGRLKPKQLASSGLDEAACRAQMAKADAARLSDPLDAAVQALRDEERAAVAEVRERVGQDRLPLLSLLQVEPLQMQSAHLSFQEFFAAHAICLGKYRLSEGSPPPWQWPAFWANTLTLGSEMGDGFGRGLLRTAGVTGDTLDLSQKLGGDGPTVWRVLAAMMKTTELKHCSLLKNSLDIESATVVTILMLDGNDIGDEGAKAIAEVLKVNAVVTTLDLADNSIEDEGAIAIAESLKVNAVLTTLQLSGNNIGVDGAFAIAEALKVNAVVTDLRLWNNNICDDGAKAIAEALKVNAVLTFLRLSGNNIGVDGAKAIAEALKVNAVLTTLDLIYNNIGPEGAIAIAEALKVNAALTKLNLENNFMGDAGKTAVQDAVKDRSGFRLVMEDLE
jgi:hypothetical protein